MDLDLFPFAVLTPVGDVVIMAHKEALKGQGKPRNRGKITCGEKIIFFIFFTREFGGVCFRVWQGKMAPPRPPCAAGKP